MLYHHIIERIGAAEDFHLLCQHIKGNAGTVLSNTSQPVHVTSFVVY
jgi:hypothetical protein